MSELEPEEIPIAWDLKPIEGYSTPSDIQRIRAEFLSEWLKRWEGIYISERKLLEVLGAMGMVIELDERNGATAMEALTYLDYDIDSGSIDPVSLARYKISRGKDTW
jgi:hypothetical protein